MLTIRSLKPDTFTRFALLILVCWATACVIAGVLRDDKIVATEYQRTAENAAEHMDNQFSRLNAELTKLRAYALILASLSDIKYVLRRFDLESSSPELLDHPETLSSPALKNLDGLLLSLSSQLGVSSIFVVTRSGYILATSRETTSEIPDATSFSFREYFQEAIAGGPGEQFAVSNVTGTAGFFFSYPVQLTNSEGVAGVVVIKVDGETFAKNFEYKPTITFITDDKDVVMLSTDHDFFLKVLSDKAVKELPAHVLDAKYTRQRFETLGFALNDSWLASNKLVDLEMDGKASSYIQISETIPKTGWRLNILYRVTGLLAARQYNALFMLCIFTAGAVMLAVGERLFRYTTGIHEQSRRDPLTNLYNRYHMDETVNPLCAMHDRGNLESLALLMLDIDHFKAINDNHGHSVGDQALRRIAEVLTGEARRSDIVYRIGGEEFVVIMVGAEKNGALKAATRIRKQVEMIRGLKPIPIHGITVSGGLAMHRSGEPLQDFLKRADALLYRAKNKGRNRIEAEETADTVTSA